MKVALITPWQNAWVPLYEKAFKDRGHEFGVFEKQAPRDSDVVLHGWCTGTKAVDGAKNIVFLRRYELFDGGLARVEWSKVQHLVCVNSWIKNIAEQIFEAEKIQTPVHLIYNAASFDKWKYADRGHGKRIGMACYVHTKKNIPLALQILAALPAGYELHIAGGIQDLCLAEYLSYQAKEMNLTMVLHQQVPSKDMDSWWDGMNYCLSTSMTEGNPNNVIEAMAKGIKPIVHNWPGAEDQLGSHLFNTVDEAVKLINGDYDSKAYRQEIEDKFSVKNIEKVVDLALG